MSPSLSPADASVTFGPEASDNQEPSSPDGWRSGDLPALRTELDRIDNTIHDLLMQRAEIVEYVARSGKPAAFRPGREAAIIRRLLGRHHGALPAVSIVRIWRELLAGTTTMQGGFSLAVHDGDPGAPLTQLAREHFGALTPLHAYKGAGQALVDVSQGAASIAVLPYPSESNDWWTVLLHHEPRLHIIGRLPFWAPRPDGAPESQALVVAATPADASGNDRSFIGLACDSDVSSTRLSGELSEAGVRPLTIFLAREQGALTTSALAEVEGYLTDDDSRFGHLGSVLRRPMVLGSYAVPIARDAP